MLNASVDPWLLWAAGFFEGEGSISIQPRTDRNHHSLNVSVTNGVKAVLDEYAERFGGQVPMVRVPVGRCKPAWRWMTYANQALAFLDAIEPYVRIERNRLRIAIAREFQEGAKHGRHAAETPGYFEWRRSCYLRMRALNERGVSPRS